MKKIVLVLGVVGLFSMVFAADAQTLLKQNGCMVCHNIMGKKTAPAFMGVARRNIRFEGVNAKANIINSIKHGSKGKYRYFPDAQMPPFPNISDEDLNTIATYILSLNSNRQRGMRKGKGSQKGMI
ncbi:MAG: cytochrome c [Sulfurospirillum sp.]